MYGELTDKNTIEALNLALDNHLQDQFEILLYKKNRKSYYRVCSSPPITLVHCVCVCVSEQREEVQKLCYLLSCLCLDLIFQHSGSESFLSSLLFPK